MFANLQLAFLGATMEHNCLDNNTENPTDHFVGWLCVNMEWNGLAYDYAAPRVSPIFTPNARVRLAFDEGQLGASFHPVSCCRREV